MVLDRSSSIRVGSRVMGSDGAEIGKVEEVHQDHLVVRGGTLFKHDLYVPIASCSGSRDDVVTLDVASGDVDAAGWRFPPQRGVGGQHEVPPGEGEPGLTTMTGAGYGAGGGVSSAGPLSPGRGDAIADRLGGSGRAGLSATSASSTDDLERGTGPTDMDEGTGDADDGDTGDDTSDDTSEDTSTDTSDDPLAQAPPLT